MNDLEIGWVAGIIEGEGCIHAQTGNGTCVCIKVAMTDEDTVNRLKAITGEGNVKGPRIPKTPRKPYWTWSVTDTAGAARLLLALYPLLGFRRQEKVGELVARLRPTRPLDPCGTTGGYIRHRKSGEPACQSCLEANRARSRRTNRNRRTRVHLSPGQGELL